ncbi:helix-turn-helix domain-containing protein [Micromonospora ureilytica]|uniref:Helix-turn-helix domain-containing protein n=1 Tax=Micromonospora ureilytica TaxID=709868 RepID=A0ABS0JLE8_9ACTN|nr:helix-turn-helix domain-containing protein [Micromonospora ureilytica]MBG6067865.1 hypothetical protein [Micromonospora ureilytica]
MIDVDGTTYVTLAEAARLLGIAPQTLRNRRSTGRTALPVALRIGTAALYRLADVEAARAQK